MWNVIAINIHIIGSVMKTVQMTLDDALVKAVDKAAKRLKKSRSAFTRDALRQALENLRITELEEKHRRGYKKYPVQGSEFSIWENEHTWGDE